MQQPVLAALAALTAAIYSVAGQPLHAAVTLDRRWRAPHAREAVQATDKSFVYETIKLEMKPYCIALRTLRSLL